MRAHEAKGVRTVLWPLYTVGQRGVLRAAQCVVLGMECGDTAWDHGGETDRSWIGRSRDGWIEGWMDRGSIDRGMDRSRGSRFQDIQDVGYGRHGQIERAYAARGVRTHTMGPVYRSTEGSTTCSGVCDACTDRWTQDVSMLGSRISGLCISESQDLRISGSQDLRI